jgi:hypothetical protein
MMYERLMGLALKNCTDITGCATLTEYENGISANNYVDLADGMLDKNYCIMSILYQGNHAWGTVWNKLFRRELIQNHRFPEGRQLEDYVIIISLFEEAEGVYFCSTPFYHYNYRVGSQSKRGFYEGLLTALESADGIRDYLIGIGADKEVLAGADYYVYLMYVLVLWELRRSGSPRRREIAKTLRKPALAAFRRYLPNARMNLGDFKIAVKLCLASFICLSDQLRS